MYVSASPFERWQNFYVIVSTSAGALTGLQFVVITLVAQHAAAEDTRQISAFGTPVVIHFGVVLLLGAIICAPWATLGAASVVLALCGFLGLGYELNAIRHARLQTAYQPEGDDWLWYFILPIAAYALLVVASFLLRGHPEKALFMVGATALLLLFIAIRNAWDTVTYIAVTRGRAAKSHANDDAAPSSESDTLQRH